MRILELRKAEKRPSDHDIKFQTKHIDQRMRGTFLLHTINLRLTVNIRLYFLSTFIAIIKLKGKKETKFSFLQVMQYQER